LLYFPDSNEFEVLNIGQEFHLDHYAMKENKITQDGESKERKREFYKNTVIGSLFFIVVFVLLRWALL